MSFLAAVSCTVSVACRKEQNADKMRMHFQVECACGNKETYGAQKMVRAVTCNLNAERPTSNIQRSTRLVLFEFGVERWKLSVERLLLSFKCQGGDSNPQGFLH